MCLCLTAQGNEPARRIRTKGSRKESKTEGPQKEGGKKFKTRVLVRSCSGIAGSNPARGMDVCLLCFVYSGLCDGLITHGVLYIVVCHCCVI